MKINSQLETRLHHDALHEYLTTKRLSNLKLSSSYLTKVAFDELLVILKDFSDLQTQGLLLKIQLYIITTLIKQRQVSPKVLNEILSGIGTMLSKIDQDQLGVYYSKLCSAIEKIVNRPEFKEPQSSYSSIRPLVEKLGQSAQSFKQKHLTSKPNGQIPNAPNPKVPAGQVPSLTPAGQTNGSEAVPDSGTRQPQSAATPPQKSGENTAENPNPFATEGGHPPKPDPTPASKAATAQVPRVDNHNVQMPHIVRNDGLPSTTGTGQDGTANKPNLNPPKKIPFKGPTSTPQCVHSAAQLSSELVIGFLGPTITSTFQFTGQLQLNYPLQQMLKKVCLLTLLQACDQLDPSQLSGFIQNAREFPVTYYDRSHRLNIRTSEIPRYYPTVREAIVRTCEQYLSSNASYDNCLYSLKQVGRCWTHCLDKVLRDQVLTKLREQQPLGMLNCSDYTVEEAITLAGNVTSLGITDSEQQEIFSHLCLFNVLYNQPAFVPEISPRVPKFQLVPFLIDFFRHLSKLPTSQGAEQFIMCLNHLEDYINLAEPSGLENLSKQLMKFYKSSLVTPKDDQMLKLQLIKDPTYPKFWRNNILAHVIKKTTDTGFLRGFFSSDSGRDLDKNIIFKFIKEGFSLDKYKVMEAFLAPDGDAALERLSFLCQLSKSGHQPSKLFVDKIVQDQLTVLAEIQREEIFLEFFQKLLAQRSRFTQVVERILQLKIQEQIICSGVQANKETVLSKFTQAEKDLKTIQQVEPQVFAITNNQQFKVFNLINADHLRTIFEKFHKKAFFKMKELKEVLQSTEPLGSLLRATELVKMGQFYENRIQQAFAEIHGERGEVSLREMNHVCELTEHRFTNMLQCSCIDLQKQHMSELKALRKILKTSGEANPLIKYKIITDEERSNLLILIKLLSLVDEFNPICNALEQIKKTLTKLKSLPKSGSTEDAVARVMDKINSLHNSMKNSPSVPISNLGFFEFVERNLISLLEQDIDFLKGLGDSMELLEHFFNRESRHFQEILFDADASLKIGPQHINSLQSLIELAKLFKTTQNTRGIAHFYEEALKRREDIAVDDLKDKRKELIQASKGFLEGNYDGRKSAFAILENSIMVFEIDLFKEDYQAYCLLHTSFNDENNPRGKVGQAKIGLDQMKDSKTKVSLYKQSLSKDGVNEGSMLTAHPYSSAKKDDLERINTFEQSIEGVIRIHKALINICRSGVVYDLSAVLRRMAKGHLMELDAALKLIREDQLTLRVQTQADKSAPTQKNHFLILAEGLESVEKEVANQLFNSNLQYHNITYLKSSQRIMLCRYLEGSDHPQHPFSLRDQEALVLANYLLSTHKMNLKILQSVRGISGGEEPTQGWAIVSLQNFLRKVPVYVIGFQPKMIKQQRADGPAQPAATEGQRVRIRYLVSDWSQQYSTAFKLITSYGELKLAHHQIYFGTSQTHSFDVENFLIRALTDPDKRLYILIDIELIPHEILIRMLEKCKSLLSKPGQAMNPNLYILLTRERDLANRKGDLATTFSSCYEFFSRENLVAVEGENLYTKDYLRRLVGNYKILTSQLSGLGKSTEIGRESKGVPLVPIFLSGDVYSQSNCSRLEVIADECQTGAAFNLHIKLDMMDNMLKSCRYLDQFLFSLIYLRCVPFGRSFLFLDKMQSCFVEVQNSYKDYILREVKMLKFGESKDIPSLTETSFLSNFDVNLWQEELSNQLKVVTVFWEAKKNGTFGFGNFDPHGARTISQNNLTELVLEALKSCVETAKAAKFFSNLTYRELQHWVSSCDFQIRHLMEVPGLDPQQIGANNDKAVAKQLSDIRLKTGQKTLELTHRLVWGVSEAIREESNRAQQLVDHSRGAHQALAIDQKELDEYCRMVQRIPRWGMGQQVNYFFYKSVFKVLYPTLSSVDADVKQLVKRFTNKDLIDYSQQPPTVLLEHLMEALSLMTDETIKAQAKIYEDDDVKKIGDLGMKVCRYMEKITAKFNKKGYIITHDNLTKILMIIQRAELCMPIVIMGATGCGKTYMINYIASCLLGQKFECFTLNSGVTEDMLINKLLQVQQMAVQDYPAKVWLLFDEFNTSPLQCLISEIMIERKCTFSNRLKLLEFPPNLVFVAACNPYRIKPNTSAVGLIHESSSRILAHRVYPIPQTLINCIFDFGQLSTESEKEYIKSLVTCGSKIKTLPKGNETANLIVQMVQSAQSFFRSCGCENSVSLRDVNRFLEFVDFGMKAFNSEEYALAVAVYICYIFRLEEKHQRQNLLQRLQESVRDKYKLEQAFFKLVNQMKDELIRWSIPPEGISLNKALMENLIALWACVSTQTPIIFCGKPGTSKTLAIRIFSDTLELDPNLLRSSIFWRQTPQVLFRNFWGSTTTTSDNVTEIFNQCMAKGAELGVRARPIQPLRQISELVSPVRLVQEPAVMATDLFEFKREKITCLVFDEIGLAEIADDNPLKVLHPLLEPVENKIAFVGLSNWRLDLSKMNRLVYVARPDMDCEDLIDTCQLGDFKHPTLVPLVKRTLEGFARGYFEFRRKEVAEQDPMSHPNFHGSRDFYEAVKIFMRNLKCIIAKHETYRISDEVLCNKLMINAIHRCFSGKNYKSVISHKRMVEEYIKQVGSVGFPIEEPNSIDLVYQNLLDPKSRHLMILSSMGFVQDSIIEQIRDFEITNRKKDPTKFEILSRTKDREDLVRVIESKLPIFISQGYTIVMKNLDELYGSMYDLLNQNYSKRVRMARMPQSKKQTPTEMMMDEGRSARTQGVSDNDEVEVEEYTCDLFIDGTSRTVPVHPEFKCIILMEELDKQADVEEVERRQQPPFLNRFEKYLIREQDFLTPESQRAKEQLLKDYQLDSPGKAKAISSINPHAIVHNLSKELVISIVVENTSEVKKRLQFHSDASSIVSILGLDTSPTNMRQAGQLMHPGRQFISLSDTINKKMLRMHSRNGILVYLQQVGNIQLPANYLELFYETHPHNTLHEFCKKLIQTPIKRLGIVFTYSTALELRQFVDDNPIDYCMIEVVEFQTEFLQRPSTCFQDELLKAKHTNKTLIVQFSKKSDWPMIQQLRAGFERALTTSSYSKPIVFVAQYMLGDFKDQGSEQGSGISYFNDNWEMAVIDDINGSEYKEFTESLQTNCSDQRYTQKISQLLKEGLRHKVLMKTSNVSTVARANNTLRLISSCSKLSDSLSKGTIKVVQKANMPILKLFDRKFSKYFDEHLDAKNLIQSKVDQLYLTEMENLLTKFEEAIPLGSLFLLSHLSELHLEQLRSVVNNRASVMFDVTPNSTQNKMDASQTKTTLSSNDVSMFKMYNWLKVNHLNLSTELDRDAKQALNQLSTLPENPAGGEIERCLATIKSQVKQKFREFSTGLLRVEDSMLPNSPQIHQMVAILVFHQHLTSRQPVLVENPIFEIIVEMGLKFVETTRRPNDSLFDFREVLILLILISKIYDGDLKVLAFYSAQLVEQRATQLSELQAVICKGFLTKGRIDLTEYIKSIQALEQITGENTVQSQVRRLELSYKLTRMHKSKSGNRTTAATAVVPRTAHPHDEVFLDHHIIVAILKQVCLAKDERILLVQIFNQTLNAWKATHTTESPETTNAPRKSKMQFTGFALEFLQACAAERKFDLKLLRTLVKSCWGYLLELDALEPLVYFEKISTILMIIISKQSGKEPVTSFPTNQEIFGLSYLAKLIIFNYRAYATRGFNQEVSLEFLRAQEIQLPGHDSRLFYLLLNYKMMCIAFTNVSDFHYLNTRGKLDWQQLQECLNTVRLTITREQRLAPLSYDRVRALCMLKSCMKAIKESSPLSGAELVGGFDDLFELQRQAQLDPALVNHVLHGFYTEIQSFNELTRVGLRKIAAKILTFSASSDQAFLIPDNQQKNAAKQAVDEITLGGRPNIDPSQLLGNLNLRLEIMNHLLSGTPPESLNNIIQSLPQNQLLRYYIQALVNPAGRAQPGAPSPLHLSLAAVLSLMDILPPTCCYSSTKAGHSMAAFTPMLNYPARDVLRYMPVMEYWNVARGRTANNQAMFTALWECTSPNCGYLVPIGDCGQLGHVGSANISTTCPGCRKQIGQLGNGRDPGLRKLNVDQVKNQYDQAIARDETPYRPEQLPQGTAQRFDESWILAKYSSSINHRTTAIFMSLVQNMIVFGVEHLTRPAGQRFQQAIPLQENSTNLSERLIQRDFRLLREALGRDEQAVFEITCLVIYRVILQCNGNPTQLTSPAQMRQLLAQSFDQIGLPGAGNTAPKLLEDYYQRKRAIQTGDETIKQNRKMMALLSGRMPMDEMRREYRGKEEQMFGFLINRTSAGITIQDVMTKLESTPREVADPNAALECEFLLQVLNNPDIVSRLRGIIAGVKRFSAFLANKFDSKLTKAEAGTKTMKQIMATDTEVRREFDAFCKLLNDEVLKESPIQDVIRQNFGFECERVEAALEQIRALTKDTTQFSFFVIYDERSPDDAPPLVYMLLTTLLTIQEKWITRFGSLAKSRAQLGFHQKNLFTSSEEALMHINSDLFQSDLIRHSQVEAVAMTLNSTLTIDYRFLVHKYAEQLFGEAQLMKVEPNIVFSDSKKKDLGVLIKRFYAKFPHISPEEDPNQVTALNYCSHQERTDFQKVLKLALDRLLNGSNNNLSSEEIATNNLTGDSTLLSIIPEDQHELVKTEIANEARLKDLQIFLTKYFGKSNVSKFEEIRTQLKRKFAGLKPLANVSGIRSRAMQEEAETRQQWVSGLKLAFVKVVNDDTMAEPTLKQRLEYLAEDSLEDEDWKPVAQCLTSLGVAPADFNLSHLVDLVDLLQDC